jgi:hypothetical protein
MKKRTVGKPRGGRKTFSDSQSSKTANSTANREQYATVHIIVHRNISAASFEHFKRLAESAICFAPPKKFDIKNVSNSHYFLCVFKM